MGSLVEGERAGRPDLALMGGLESDRHLSSGRVRELRPTVAGVLRKAHELDAELTEQSDDDEIQLNRNALATETVELLSTVLGKLRTTGMELPPDRPADKRAASILFDWHEWSMQRLAAPD